MPRLKLTKAIDGKEIWVIPSAISLIECGPDGKGSVILIGGKVIGVTEDPSEILTMEEELTGA